MNAYRAPVPHVCVRYGKRRRRSFMAFWGRWY